jgi:phage protein U
MSVLLYLGDVRLNHLAVTDMPYTRVWEYAAHKVIEGIPVLQLTGRDSDTYALNVRVHPDLGVPARIIDKLKESGDSGEVMVLQTSRGEQLGSYVLTSLRVRRTWTTGDGVILMADLSLELHEHPPVDIEFDANSGIAISGANTPATATPEDIDDSGNPADVPLSKIVRAG